MSGAIATEYEPQVNAVPIASASPTMLPEKPPEPDATKPTPTIETTVATQKSRVSRSSPTELAIRPMKIGVVPRKRVTVAAVVLSIA